VDINRLIRAVAEFSHPERPPAPDPAPGSPAEHRQA